MQDHMLLWAGGGLIFIIVGTITSVRTILKIYASKIQQDESLSESESKCESEQE